MPLIKPRTRGKQFVRLITRLEHETNETLYAYAQFLGEPVEYVLNQVIDTLLAKDKDFITWRAKNTGSYVRSNEAPGRIGPRGPRETAAETTSSTGPRALVASSGKTAG